MQTTRLTLIDTGFFPQFLGEFAAFRPGKENEVEKFLIGPLPAIRITRGRIELLSVLINGRFVLQIRTENQNARATESWFRLVDVTKLGNQPLGPDKIPQPVTITRLDELHPEKNSSYPLSWASEEQQKEAAAQAEAEERARKSPQ